MVFCARPLFRNGLLCGACAVSRLSPKGRRQADPLSLGTRHCAPGRPAGTYADWAAAWRGVATIWRERRDWPAGGQHDYARASRLASALTKAAPDLAAEGFDVHVPELRGWAASGGDLPLVVADRVAGRLVEFVE